MAQKRSLYQGVIAQVAPTLIIEVGFGGATYDALKMHPDGSLDIDIQNLPPGADQLNSLPAGDGMLWITMRIVRAQLAVAGARWDTACSQAGE